VTARPPPWRNEDEVVKFVAAQVVELRSEVNRLAAFTLSGSPGPDAGEDLKEAYKLVMVEVDRFFDDEDRREQWGGACEAAARLADRVAPAIVNLEGPEELGVNSKIAGISPEEWSLVAEFLRGQRSVKTGRRAGEPGRPKMWISDRRRYYPGHGAADYVPLVMAILKRAYPSQSRPAIRERAIEVAARVAGIKSARGTEALRTHMRRSRKRRL
jgi:hypothetical protein